MESSQWGNWNNLKYGHQYLDEMSKQHWSYDARYIP